MALGVACMVGFTIWKLYDWRTSPPYIQYSNAARVLDLPELVMCWNPLPTSRGPNYTDITTSGKPTCFGIINTPLPPVSTYDLSQFIHPATSPTDFTFTGQVPNTTFDNCHHFRPSEASLKFTFMNDQHASTYPYFNSFVCGYDYNPPLNSFSNDRLAAGIFTNQTDRKQIPSMRMGAFLPNTTSQVLISVSTYKKVSSEAEDLLDIQVGQSHNWTTYGAALDSRVTLPLTYTSSIYIHVMLTNTFASYPERFTVTKTEEKLSVSFLDVISSVGGAISIVMGGYAIMMGAQRLDPRGLVQTHIAKAEYKKYLEDLKGEYVRQVQEMEEGDVGKGDGGRLVEELQVPLGGGKVKRKRVNVEDVAARLARLEAMLEYEYLVPIHKE
ncbi:hypothetical protein HK097_000622 [Rhizophlyctis rosea]|uniref:Uncharacterized protein n=1 Tax=Rhizophlyctis rosea TaxID=64517 RepID=A0AAD5WZD9_9FUNG|nr:hypothetical protein HK097_000622 [Rhizophlyctis rosea]